jgi:hypothetical protein
MGAEAADTRCKPEACAIQACLAENGYQQRACLPAIRALVRCCEGVAAAAAAGKEPPVSCGGFSRALLQELEAGGKGR